MGSVSPDAEGPALASLRSKRPDLGCNHLLKARQVYNRISGLSIGWVLSHGTPFDIVFSNAAYIISAFVIPLSLSCDVPDRQSTENKHARG